MTNYLGYLGKDNGNVFTRAEALDSGETDRSLHRGVRSGLLVRLRRGAYVPAETYTACDDSGKHLLHARAALAAQTGQAVLTGASAAALYGFALYQQDLSVVHLLRMDAGAPRRAASASHHAITRAVAADETHCLAVDTPHESRDDSTRSQRPAGRRGGGRGARLTVPAAAPAIRAQRVR